MGLRSRLATRGGDKLRDPDRRQQAAIEQDGKTWTLRTSATGVVGSLFTAAGIALPTRGEHRAARLAEAPQQATAS